jgi:hypothetical protein
MDKLNVFSSRDIAKITQHRSGEIKFGEKIITVPSEENWISFITYSEAKFVLIGLPEDIGIKANLGRTGAASAFESTLKSIVNFQHNKFCKGNELLVLGEINFSKEMEISKNLDTQNKEDRKKLFQIVENIDKDDAYFVEFDKNLRFDTELKNFGMISELQCSKINEVSNILKMRNAGGEVANYPMIDEFGLQYSERFIFKSPFDSDYYIRTKTNTL